MSTLHDEINSRIDSLDILIERLEESVSKKPQGHLIIAKERGNTRFYQNINANSRVYLNKSKVDVIRNLAQKHYEELLIKAAKCEKETLLRTTNALVSTDNVWDTLNDEIKQLVDPVISSDDGFAAKWREESYYKAKVTENHIHETIEKDMVRSKSEVLIADRLHIAGIPYRYEHTLILWDGHNRQKYYPDFTILNKRTRQVFYWEHLGKLGDEDYCCQNLEKLDIYVKNGIIQGKNLILTYECKDKPISTSVIDLLIDAYLR